MKARIRPENANFAYQFTDNHQKYGDFGGIAAEIETILHQCADRAIVMLVEVIVMVLGDRK